MNHHEDALEFNLKDLLFYILYRWKFIAIAAILAAIALGIIQAYPQYKSAASISSIEAAKENQQQYYEQLEVLEQSIHTTKEKIKALQEYMNESILVNANSQSVHIAKATYHIDTGYQIIPNSNYQNPNRTELLLWYYRNYLTDYSTYTELSAGLGIDATYLLELVKVSDSTADVLFVQVIHPEEDMALTILNYLDEMLFRNKDYLDRTIEEHTLTQMTCSCGIYPSETVATTQQEKAEQMQLFTQELSTQNSELKQYKKNNAPNTVHVLSTFIKWAVVGGLAGGVLLIVLFFLLGIFDNRIYSPDCISSRYNIVYLGGILPSGLRFDFITKWLRKLDCLLTQNSPENLQFLAANIENHLGTNRKILICNDLNNGSMAALEDELQAQLQEAHIISAGSLLEDASAVRALPKCDCILLVFNRNHTCHKHIRKALNQIQECGKETLGFIFVG